jgi:hypothetical protein
VKLIIAILGVTLATSAMAQGQMKVTTEEVPVYGDVMPGRNWNLLILAPSGSPSLTVHLYKEECEAILSYFTSYPPARQECFETPGKPAAPATSPLTKP